MIITSIFVTLIPLSV